MTIIYGIEIWLGIDIATVFLGVGNLMKLRHLVYLSKAAKILRIAIGSVQVASSVLTTMLNFVNGCEGDGFCQKLRNYLFWLDLLGLGADAITERMLRQSAREADMNIKFSSLQKLMAKEDKEAIASVWAEDFGAHAIAVDKISGGKGFHLRPAAIVSGIFV